MKYQVKDKFAEHVRKSRENLSQVYKFENKNPAVYICDAAWWRFGQKTELIPPNYTNGNIEGMLDYQVELLLRHLDRGWNDGMEPMLSPWYGTAVVPSALGMKISNNPDMDPAGEMMTGVDEAFVKNLKMPDPYKDGLMPIILETINYFKENCDLEINLTDMQGPLSTAFLLVGYENFILWAYEDPDLLHELMDKVSDIIIMWVKKQKEVMGVPYDSPAAQMNVRGLDGMGGAFLSDDDAILMSADMYKEFAKPYNEKVLAAFGGGGIHCCGDVSHQADNLKNTKGLTIYHNCMLGDFKSSAITQKALAEKGIVYIAADFNPVDNEIDEYYDTLFNTLDPKGLVVASYMAPVIGLTHKKYDPVIRDEYEIAKKIDAAIKRNLK